MKAESKGKLTSLRTEQYSNCMVPPAQQLIGLPKRRPTFCHCPIVLEYKGEDPPTLSSQNQSNTNKRVFMTQEYPHKQVK